MPAVSTNIKLDPDVKKQAQELFSELGMSLSTAVTIFLKQSIRERSIPFHVGDPFYSRENQEYLARITSEIDNGKAVMQSHGITEAGPKRNGSKREAFARLENTRKEFSEPVDMDREREEAMKEKYGIID